MNLFGNSEDHWVTSLKRDKSSGMRKIKVDDCVCQGELFDHTRIKNKILSEIENDECNETSGGDLEYKVDDKVSKLDWTKASDFTRPWIKIFLPNFKKTVNGFLGNLGYETYTLEQMWYQQYLEGDTHGWHTHSSTYTGVYYLEFPKGSSRTELYSPFNFKKHTITSKEGDIIIFPSHWIHRGPPNSSNRKTIISFNFKVDFWNRAIPTK
mgnify:CR=1 FL=1|tara:strand:+ start:1312 stop:1941 length:630 start_codon:yes stop_codon:yes gene_type:complete